jgi:hypothetical protein
MGFALVLGNIEETYKVPCDEFTERRKDVKEKTSP